jgi:hypothetical protein
MAWLKGLELSHAINSHIRTDDSELKHATSKPNAYGYPKSVGIPFLDKAGSLWHGSNACRLTARAYMFNRDGHGPASLCADGGSAHDQLGKLVTWDERRRAGRRFLELAGPQRSRQLLD